MCDISEYLVLLYGDTYTLLKEDLQNYFTVKDFQVQRNLTRTTATFQSPLTRRYLPVELKLRRDATNQCAVVKKFDEKTLSMTNEKEYHRIVLIISWTPSSSSKVTNLINNLQARCQSVFPSGEIVIKITQAFKPETKLSLKTQFSDINIIRDDRELFAFFDETFDL